MHNIAFNYLLTGLKCGHMRTIISSLVTYTFLSDFLLNHIPDTLQLSEKVYVSCKMLFTCMQLWTKYDSERRLR